MTVPAPQVRFLAGHKPLPFPGEPEHLKSMLDALSYGRRNEGSIEAIRNLHERRRLLGAFADGILEDPASTLESLDLAADACTQAYLCAVATFRARKIKWFTRLDSLLADPTRKEP